MEHEQQKLRALILLAANGAALAMAAQYAVDLVGADVSSGVANFAFTYLLMTFTGAALSYFLLGSIGKPSFRIRELYCMGIFGAHVLSLCVALFTVIANPP